MSRTLTASDRSALLKLASSLPVGDGSRRAILAALSKTSVRVDLPKHLYALSAKVYADYKRALDGAKDEVLRKWPTKVAASDIKWKRLLAGKMQGWSYTDDDLVVQVLSVKKITTVKDKNIPSWSDVTNDGEMYADGIPELMEQAGRAEKDLAQWQRQGWWPKPVGVEAWRVFTTHIPTRTHMESVTDFDTSREALAKAEAAIPRLKARMRPSWLKVT